MAGRYLEIPSHHLFGMDKKDWILYTDLPVHEYYKEAIKQMTVNRMSIVDMANSYADITSDDLHTISAIDRAVKFCTVRLKEMDIDV